MQATCRRLKPRVSRHLELPTCGLARLDDERRNCTPTARRQDCILDATHSPEFSRKLCSLELHREAVKVDRRMGMLERCDPKKKFEISKVPISQLVAVGCIWRARALDHNACG
jgi:hypothetical protein